MYAGHEATVCSIGLQLNPPNNAFGSEKGKHSGKQTKW
jgi:hypothetical protein